MEQDEIYRLLFNTGLQLKPEKMLVSTILRVFRGGGGKGVKSGHVWVGLGKVG